ncbi:MAG TPA: carbohydrate-binding domain-containing protein [Thermodesulfobacteriota bacterium]
MALTTKIIYINLINVSLLILLSCSGGGESNGRDSLSGNPQPGDTPDLALPSGSTSPIIHTNDGNMDCYTLEYLMALASAGEINLVGIIPDSAFGGRPGLPDIWETTMYTDIVGKARRSGMINIPDPAAGPARPLAHPVSDTIEDTEPIDTPGSRLIVQQANKATPENPLVIVTGGPLTAVADAYLLDNSIDDKVVVVSVFERENDMNGYNGQLDGWAAFIVLQKFRYVQFKVSKDNAPDVFKSRLGGTEIPENELKRFMVDKDQLRVNLPDNVDIDVPPAIALMRTDYVLTTKRVSFSHWIDATNSWGNPFSKVPAFKDDPNGNALVVTSASKSIATDEWWRVLSNPAAYSGTVVQQAPFYDTPASIPGVIEAEDFDWGGKGYAFFNTFPTVWPTHRVDASNLNLEDSTDVGGGFNIKGTEPGDWLEYTVSVTSSGTYRIEARVASEESGNVFRIKFNGVDKTGAIGVPNTGGEQSWQTVTVEGVQLNAGEQVMRIEMDTGGFNLNYVNFVLVN